MASADKVSERKNAAAQKIAECRKRRIENESTEKQDKRTEGGISIIV